MVGSLQNLKTEAEPAAETVCFNYHSGKRGMFQNTQPHHQSPTELSGQCRSRVANLCNSHMHSLLPAGLGN
jgi:hypothetical protein